MVNGISKMECGSKDAASLEGTFGLEKRKYPLVPAVPGDTSITMYFGTYGNEWSGVVISVDRAVIDAQGETGKELKFGEKSAEVSYFANGETYPWKAGSLTIKQENSGDTYSGALVGVDFKMADIKGLVNATFTSATT